MNTFPQPSDSNFNKRIKFTHLEDALLVSLVQKFGPNDWKTIVSHMPGRTERQCKDRWLNYLNSGRKCENFTEEEDRKIFELYQLVGPRWVKIAQIFPGRTSVDVRNRCLRILRLSSNGKLWKLNHLPNEKRKDADIFVNEVRKIVFPSCDTFPFPEVKVKNKSLIQLFESCENTC
jgi:NADPH-dependent 7-cyano-7-deazaguanine reductase QueF